MARTVNHRPQTKFAKVMFSQVSVYPQGGCVPQARMPPRAHTHPRACMPPPPWQILRDAVNERAVRILLECIVVEV